MHGCHFWVLHCTALQRSKRRKYPHKHRFIVASSSAAGRDSYSEGLQKWLSRRHRPKLNNNNGELVMEQYIVGSVLCEVPLPKAKPQTDTDRGNIWLQPATITIRCSSRQRLNQGMNERMNRRRRCNPMPVVCGHGFGRGVSSMHWERDYSLINP